MKFDSRKTKPVPIASIQTRQTAVPPSNAVAWECILCPSDKGLSKIFKRQATQRQTGVRTQAKPKATANALR